MNHGTLKLSISSENISGIYLVRHIIQTSVIAVCDNTISERKVIHAHRVKWMFHFMYLLRGFLLLISLLQKIYIARGDKKVCNSITKMMPTNYAFNRQIIYAI